MLFVVFVCFVIEILMVENYFFSLKSTFRAKISEKKSDKTYNSIEIDKNTSQLSVDFPVFAKNNNSKNSFNYFFLSKFK